MHLTAVFYDGACPLCRREIAHYRKLRGATRVSWIDIAHDDASLEAHGLRREVALARFHVRDRAGHWHSGAWAFAELWSNLAGYRWLAAGLRAMRLLPLLDRAYVHFARWRLRRRCSADRCDLNPER